MLKEINWDNVFAWKIWQIIKWIWGALLIIVIVYCIIGYYAYGMEFNLIGRIFK